MTRWCWWWVVCCIYYLRISPKNSSPRYHHVRIMFVHELLVEHCMTHSHTRTSVKWVNTKTSLSWAFFVLYCFLHYVLMKVLNIFHIICENNQLKGTQKKPQCIFVEMYVATYIVANVASVYAIYFLVIVAFTFLVLLLILCNFLWFR